MSGITNPAEPYFKDGIWGWDAAAWQKLALLWGYTEQWTVVGEETLAANGNFLFTTAALDAEYVYKLEFASLHNNAGPRGRADIDIMTSGQNNYLVWHTALPQWEPLAWTGSVTLVTGDVVRFYIRSCIAGDVVTYALYGYRMKITS